MILLDKIKETSPSHSRIVDEMAVAESLKSGHLRGAAVDVYENEPNIAGCPLIGLRNVILTPHSGGLSRETMKRVPRMIMENLIRVVN